MTSSVVYKVPGLHCEGCERSIEEEVSQVTGVISVSADRHSEEVVVEGTDVDKDEVRSAIAVAGYETA